MSDRREGDQTQELIIGEAAEPGKTVRASRPMPPPAPATTVTKAKRASATELSPSRVPAPPPAAPQRRSRVSAPLAPPPQLAPATLAVDDQALAQRIREELGRESEPQRAARLHYDLAVLLERTESKPASAAEHFRKAAELRPDHLPALAGARRTLLALGRYTDALQLLNAEQRVCTTPASRARLALEKGQLLEHRLSRLEDALAAYHEGLALDGRNLELLRATARAERRAERWDALDATLERLAQAIEHDPAFRAAVIAERARLCDVRRGNPARAAELYAAALAVDPDVGGAAEAIKRLAYGQGHFKPLLGVLEQEALLAQDPELRASARARMSELLDEQLGELDPAIEAQELAAGELPEDRALLERLHALHVRRGGASEQLAVLARLRELARDAGERCALCMRMGALAESALTDAKAAESHYLAALESVPAHRPAIAALAALYARGGDAHGLLAVHARELDLVADDLAKADLLARMGALWESGPRDLEQAAQHYTRALGLQADHDGALLALDRLLPALGRFRELVQVYERVIDKLAAKEQATAYLFRIGALYEDRLDEPKGAIAAYERVLRLHPDHLGALHALQRVATRAGDNALALRALQREAKLAAPSAHAADLAVRAAELLADRVGDAKAAIAQLEQVLKEHPAHAVARERLCALYRREQRFEDLLLVLSRSHDRSTSPKSRAELAFEIGQLCEQRLGRTADAIAAYGRALAAEPNHPEAFAALCAALQAGAKWTELAAALETRAKLAAEPRERARLYAELGRLWEERLRDPVRALDGYGRALEARPTHRAALDARARLLWARADVPRLVKALHAEAAQASDPRVATAALERAAALEAESIGDAKTALASYLAVLERAPQRASALLAVEALGVGLRDRKTLAANYAAQAASAKNPQLKVAALRDLAHSASTPEEATEAYRALLALRADDAEALTALAERARAAGEAQSELALRARLAQAASDRAVAAAHHLAIAAQIEATDASQALVAYRTALALDPESLLAVRGLSRAALAFALPEALSEAARAEARVTRDVGVSVELLLRAAALREQSADLIGAAAEAQHALELAPEEPRAAELLARVLAGAGEHERLGELLARAADASESADRRADLYTQVARLRAENPRNLPAAVSAAERALLAKPDHAPALGALASHLESMGRWEQAVEAHERHAAAVREAPARAEALLAVARVAVEQLHDPARAQKSLRALLSARPDDRRGLTLQAKLHAAAGKHADALALLRRLVETAPGEADRVLALLELAAAEAREGQAERSEQALREALTLEGPGGAAERAYREQLGAHATHARYVEALARHLSAQVERGHAGGRTVLAIARAQAEGLGDAALALATLREGARAFPDDVELCVQYAARLCDARKADDAIAHLRVQLARAPERAELWQALSHAHAAAGRPAEALSSAVPLLVLDAASGEQRISLQTRKARPADSAAQLAGSLLRELDPENALESPAAALAQTLAPTLTRLMPIELASFGVSRRDRVPEESDQPVRRAVDRVARILGAPECDVYLHDRAAHEVALGLGEPPVLLLPRSLLGKPKSQLVFALARPVFCLRSELAAAVALPARELAVLLAGAVRRQHPGYGANVADESDLDEASRTITKAVPWLARKRLDEAAAALAAAGDQDLQAWCEQVRRVAARVALLLCDDLPGALELVTAAHGKPAHADPLARDLLQLWASEVAVRYRQRLTAG